MLQSKFSTIGGSLQGKLNFSPSHGICLYFTLRLNEIQQHEGAYNVTQATRMKPSDAFEHDKKAINNFTAELYSQLLSVQIKKLSQPKHDFTGEET